MSKLLRQTTSGFIYVWTPQLAERSDMEPFEPENTRENSKTTDETPKVEPDVSKAVEAFRAAVGKPGRKPRGQA